jgi:hypothetical protein
MTTLDQRGQQRLYRLQELLGDTYFQDVPPQEGKDDANQETETLDAAVRFVSVRIEKFERIRTSSALAEALSQAYAAADGLRALRSAELSPRREELIARAESVRNGTYQWPETRRYIGSTSDGLNSTAVKQRVRTTAKSGSSANGYLAVSLPGGAFGSMQVTTDEVWLQSVTAQKVEQALREAITEAGEWEQ